MSERTTPNIVTLTANPCIDRCCSVEHVGPNHKLRCHSVSRQPGGGGINVARAINRLEGEALALWPGGGAMGDLLQGLLDREGLSNRRLGIAQTTRENINVYESSSGSQFRFGMPGASLSSSEVDQLVEESVRLAASASFFVVSGSLPFGVRDDFYACLSQILPANVKLIIDCSGEPLRRALDAGVYLIKPNFAELSDLVGHELKDDRAVESAARSIIDRRQVHVIVVSLGAGGAMLVTEEQVYRIESPTVEINSRIGAGDSMVAGVVLGLARSWTLLNAVRYGVCAGTAAVMTPGVELCRQSDTERLYKQINTKAHG